jgi:membrane dipeptidase
MIVSIAAAQDRSSKSDRTHMVVMGDEAQRIHAAALLFDGHNDLPWRFRELGRPSFDRLDIARLQPELHTDIPRLRRGGVKAQFWSAYVPASTRNDGQSLLQTLEQIDFVHSLVDRYPDTFELALGADDVRRIVASGKIASLIGVEGGHSIENSLGVLRQLHARGVRYLTLTHSDTLDWADSATDDAIHGGLSPFGERVIQEMNRLGMLVDLSHVSVETMHDALRLSTAPIMFSHSSARAIADHPRNVPDEILPLVRRNDGIVMVNFYPGFVVPASARRGVERMTLRRRLQAELDDNAERERQLAAWDLQHPLDTGSIHDVVDHIEHIAKVAGIDHVGLGSDFDGIDCVPGQLEDVSSFPKITQELLDRGYTADQIAKILGENMLRVLASNKGG